MKKERMRRIKSTNVKAVVAAMALGGLLFAAAPAITAQAASGSELYCLYNPVSGEYLYTIDATEKASLESAWIYEGVVCTMPSSSGSATYRMYDPASTKHLYTSDEAEIAKLTSEGWQKEGISYFVDETRSAPVYRLFNQKTGDHAFGGDVTAAKMEQKGWTREGIAYYSLSVNDDFAYSDASTSAAAGGNTSVSATDTGSFTYEEITRAQEMVPLNDLAAMMGIAHDTVDTKFTLKHGADGYGVNENCTLTVTNPGNATPDYFYVCGYTADFVNWCEVNRSVSPDENWVYIINELLETGGINSNDDANGNGNYDDDIVPAANLGIYFYKVPVVAGTPVSLCPQGCGTYLANAQATGRLHAFYFGLIDTTNYADDVYVKAVSANGWWNLDGNTIY